MSLDSHNSAVRDDKVRKKEKKGEPERYHDPYEKARRQGPKPGFIRVKLIELDPPPDSLLKHTNKTIEPYCMVNIKEVDTSEVKDKKDKKRTANMIVAAFNTHTNTVNMIQKEKNKKDKG